VSIIERTNYPYILTIIDDGSKEEDPGKQFLRRMSENLSDHLNIIFNETNIGVTKNLNKGFSLYPEMDCIRLDADIEIQSKDWLNRLATWMKNNPDCGVVGPLGVDADFVTIQTAGQWLVISPEDNKKLNGRPFEVFDKFGELRHNLDGYPIEVDSVLGCCAYLRRSMIDKLGGVDENYFGWVEDNDFCVGVRNLGLSCYVLPDVSYCHHHHAPKRSYEETQAILRKSEKRFIEKWGFSLYEPSPYWDEIVKRYKGTAILWRYNRTI
jgi:GT2 family glycosyltransferase